MRNNYFYRERIIGQKKFKGCLSCRDNGDGTRRNIFNAKVGKDRRFYKTEEGI